MRALERACVGAAVAVALAAIGCGAGALDRGVDHAAPVRTVVPERVTTQTLPVKSRCVEDDPCWDCATMGNRVCGLRGQAGTFFVHPTGVQEWRP